MPADKKQELVERLVDLTVRDIMKSSKLSTGIGREIANRMSPRIRQEQIDLRLKHFDIDQVRALLDFYSTEMGRSILASQFKIDEELTEGISIISSGVNQEVASDIRSGKLDPKNGKGSATNT